MPHVRHAALLATLTAALGLTACGGGEGKDVKDALAAMASARETGNSGTYCKGLTPESVKLIEVVASGVYGDGADCTQQMGEEVGAGSGGLTPDMSEAIDSSDVDIEGDVARIKGQGDEERLPLRRVDGEWLLDLANAPQYGYSLRGSAACTEGVIESAERPLPRATRDAIAEEAEHDAEQADRFLHALEEVDPPRGKRDTHDELVKLLRRSAAAWRRTAKGIRGFGSPIDVYNKGLGDNAKMFSALDKNLKELSVGCLGNVQTLTEAKQFLERADAACVRASKQLDAADGEPGAIKRIGRSLERRLRMLDPPKRFDELYARSVKALRDAYDEIGLARGGEEAVERLELMALRPVIGFNRIGLLRCAEL